MLVLLIVLLCLTGSLLCLELGLALVDPVCVSSFVGLTGIVKDPVCIGTRDGLFPLSGIVSLPQEQYLI